MSALLDAALKIAARGWPVFPCRPDKRPYTGHGFHDAGTDAERIHRWWSRWPNALIGVPTGVVFDVLDVDVRANGTGWAAFNAAKRAGLIGEPRAVVRTPSGGLHVYLRPAGHHNDSLRCHLDYRGSGGYVITPPSAVNGGAYELIKWSPDAEGTADWPAIRRLLQPPPAALKPGPLRGRPSDISALAAWMTGQGEGNRNGALFWSACTALESGIDDLSLLAEAAHTTGLPAGEVSRTIASAQRRVGAARLVSP
jgi:hypothetical protein